MEEFDEDKAFWKELKGLWAKGECGKFQACIEGILKRSPQQRPGVPPPPPCHTGSRCLGGRAATRQGVQACGPKDEGCKTACDVEETEHDKLDQCAAKSCIEALSTEQSKHATRAKRPSRDKMRAEISRHLYVRMHGGQQPVMFLSSPDCCPTAVAVAVAP